MNKTTVELLDNKFRVIMQEGRVDKKAKHDILDLTKDQIERIVGSMKAVGKSVSEEEVLLCFKSFRKTYWKTHKLPPRAQDIMLSY